MRVLGRISYDGSKFSGFQRLNNGLGIQNELERVLSIIAKKKIKITGAGRTDAGVHALDQCIHFDLDINFSLDKLKYALNRLLKDGIKVNSLEKVKDDFNARYDVLEKTYEYRILLKEKNPFLVNYTSIIYQNLDILKMQEASKLFLGEHDFKNFVSGERLSYIAKIDRIDIKNIGKQLIITLKGKSFYRYMVRHIVGALLDVGLGKCDESKVKEALENPGKTINFSVAIPNGLYLKKIKY